MRASAAGKKSRRSKDQREPTVPTLFDRDEYTLWLATSAKPDAETVRFSRETDPVTRGGRAVTHAGTPGPVTWAAESRGVAHHAPAYARSTLHLETRSHADDADAQVPKAPKPADVLVLELSAPPVPTVGAAATASVAAETEVVSAAAETEVVTGPRIRSTEPAAAVAAISGTTDVSGAGAVRGGAAAGALRGARSVNTFRSGIQRIRFVDDRTPHPQDANAQMPARKTQSSRAANGTARAATAAQKPVQEAPCTSPSQSRRTMPDATSSAARTLAHDSGSDSDSGGSSSSDSDNDDYPHEELESIGESSSSDEAMDYSPCDALSDDDTKMGEAQRSGVARHAVGLPQVRRQVKLSGVGVVAVATPTTLMAHNDAQTGGSGGGSGGGSVCTDTESERVYRRELRVVCDKYLKGDGTARELGTVFVRVVAHCVSRELGECERPDMLAVAEAYPETLHRTEKTACELYALFTERLRDAAVRALHRMATVPLVRSVATALARGHCTRLRLVALVGDESRSVLVCPLTGTKRAQSLQWVEMYSTDAQCAPERLVASQQLVTMLYSAFYAMNFRAYVSSAQRAELTPDDWTRRDEVHLFRKLAALGAVNAACVRVAERLHRMMLTVCESGHVAVAATEAAAAAAAGP